MSGLLTLIYGAAAYAVFFGSFVYAVGFVGNMAVPKSIDSGIAGTTVELFGLAQVLARLRNREMAAPVFKTPLFYKWVRHPIYLGFLLAFWAAPTMTVGHLIFSSAMTIYVLVGARLEERDLVAAFGDRYRLYQREVGMLVPFMGRGLGHAGPSAVKRSIGGS